LQEIRVNLSKACNMKPTKTATSQTELFRERLSNQLNPREPLFILAGQINWSVFEETFGAEFTDGPGQPPKPIRLMVGLMMLQHMNGLSDEEVVKQWVQNPYWQYFCGFDYLQWELPADGSSMTRWRKRIGKEGLEKILAETIVVALRTETVSSKDLQTVIADTTVMEKNITFPTDSKLLNRAREQLTALAAQSGVKLRQTYKRTGHKAEINAGKYAHAKQFKRMRKEVKKLKIFLGRVTRDIERKIKGSLELQETFADLLGMANRLLVQEKDSSNKLYSLHAPETYCIAKGKAHKPYEFGCKVSLVLTHKQGLALSSMALVENEFDGHTLDKSLRKAEELSGAKILEGFVDKGYKGHGVTDTKIYMSGQKRGVSKAIKKRLKRRSAIEPHIGHMKSDGNLRRNFLKGILGDALNALLCAVGHNLRMILRKIISFFILWIANAIRGTQLENHQVRPLACS
jgi:transposase, IS5 family